MVKGIEQVVILPQKKQKDGVLVLLIFNTTKHCTEAFKKFSEQQVVIDDTIVRVKRYKETVASVNLWLSKRPKERPLCINVDEANKGKPANPASPRSPRTPSSRNDVAGHTPASPTKQPNPQSPRSVQKEQGTNRPRTSSHDQTPGSPQSTSKKGRGNANRSSSLSKNRSRSRSRSRSHSFESH